MNIHKLANILADVSVQVRKGEVVTKENVGDTLQVVNIDAMPAESDLNPNIPLEIVDLVMLKVAVDKEQALAYKGDIVQFLKDYPNQETLRKGPSYIELGAELGSQGLALQLMAVGDVIGVWHLVTPATLGVKDGDMARDMAGRGFIMVTPFNPNG